MVRGASFADAPAAAAAGTGSSSAPEWVDASASSASKAAARASSSASSRERSRPVALVVPRGPTCPVVATASAVSAAGRSRRRSGPNTASASTATAAASARSAAATPRKSGSRAASVFSKRDGSEYSAAALKHRSTILGTSVATFSKSPLVPSAEASCAKAPSAARRARRRAAVSETAPFLVDASSDSISLAATSVATSAP